MLSVERMSNTLIRSDILILSGCIRCAVDGDCEPNHFCKTLPDGVRACALQPLMQDFDWHHSLHLVVLAVTAFVAAGAGGNGVNSVNIPVMIALLSLSPSEVRCGHIPTCAYITFFH